MPEKEPQNSERINIHEQGGLTPAHLGEVHHNLLNRHMDRRTFLKYSALVSGSLVLDGMIGVSCSEGTEEKVNIPENNYKLLWGRNLGLFEGVGQYEYGYFVRHWGEKSLTIDDGGNLRVEIAEKYKVLTLSGGTGLIVFESPFTKKPDKESQLAHKVNFKTERAEDWSYINDNYRLFAVDAKTGNETWSQEGYYKAFELPDSGIVIGRSTTNKQGLDYENYAAFDMFSGEKLWEHKFHPQSSIYEVRESLYWIESIGVFPADEPYKLKLTKINAKSGEIHWKRKNFADGYLGEGVDIHGEYDPFLFLSTPYELHTIDALNGHEIGKMQLIQPKIENQPGPVESRAGDRLVIGINSHLFEADIVTGALRFQKYFGNTDGRPFPESQRTQSQGPSFSVANGYEHINWIGTSNELVYVSTIKPGFLWHLYCFDRGSST